MTTVTVNRLSILLRPDFECGTLYWRSRPEEFFKTGRDAKAWNNRFAGAEAFTALCRGYRHGRIDYNAYYAHRVIFALFTGAWPRHGVDHINGDILDNRPENLRDVPQSVNAKNQRARRQGAFAGVTCRGQNSFVAQITADGKHQYLGTFRSEQEAHEAYLQAAEKLGFTERHGRAEAALIALYGAECGK